MGLKELPVAHWAKGLRPALYPTVPLASGVFLLVLVLLPPQDPIEKIRALAYGVCHQLPARSYFLAGVQLPLCARLTGLYLAAAVTLGLLLLSGKGKAALLPPLPVLGLLGLFVGAMGIDGINSYLSFFPQLPHLYEPQNPLRLLTGSLTGVSLALLLYPVLNATLWRTPSPQRVIGGILPLLGLLLLVGLILLPIHLGIDLLLYPVALLSGLGLLAVLSMANTIVVALLLQRNGQVHRLAEASALLTLGLALGIGEAIFLGQVRAVLTSILGLPF